MATPLYKKLKGNGYSTYVFPSAAEDISAQNENYTMNFSKFTLLDLDLEKMDLSSPEEFNTESNNVLADKGDLLVASLRNYVANHEVVLRESLVNNNNYFYDPNVLATTTERIFWKWIRKSGVIDFEPAIPNEEYIDIAEFSVDENEQDDYFKEYLWRERKVTDYTLTNITDTLIDTVDPIDNITKRIYTIQFSSSTNLKPQDKIEIRNEGTINIGFTGSKKFIVNNVSTTSPQSKNDTIEILSDTTLIFNNSAVAKANLIYKKVIQYVGEISSQNHVAMANKSYKEIIAYIPDQNGATPDILFRLKSDKNYSPSLQFPILPSQDQPEIVGGELFESPLLTKPDEYPGDQYAYFDVDQKYRTSNGFLDRKRGEYYGVFSDNRKDVRVVQAPYVYPEFDGSNLDGMTLDFDANHYTRMNLPNKKSKNFDEFNAQSFNNVAPKDFKFNAILWYYEAEDKVTGQKSTNLYGITFVNPVVDNKLESYTKLVTNGKQDGLSYQFSINFNYNINNDNLLETYDPAKTYSLFGFDLYNEVMKRVSTTNEIFLKLASNINVFADDLENVKSLIYTQTDIRDINNRVDSIYKLVDLYQRNQIKDSETVSVEIDNTTNPPSLKLNSKDSRFGLVQQLPINTLYNNQNNQVIDYKITVPKGKDFLLNVINNDMSDITLDRENLNIVLDRDLDYRQTCVVNIFPDGSRFNKKLNISILSNMIPNLDKTRGYSLFDKPLDLPIDQNLNPNLQLKGISERWENIPDDIYPEDIIINKISDNYYVSIGMKSMVGFSFRVGDVITLNNFNMVYGDIVANLNGQFEIVGEINKSGNGLVYLDVVVDLASFKSLYDLYSEESEEIGPSYSLGGDIFTQPVSIRINSGYKISITNIDRVSETLNEKYLIEVEPLRKKNIK